MNEEPFVGSITLPTSEEIKERVFGYYATQNRAVTAQDYVSIAYGMPTKFGAVKRAALVKDFDEFKRNLNLYVISENTSGKLIAANSTLKSNLRSWLLQYKMVNDTVDILDAAVINFSLVYTVMADINTNRFTALNRANAAVRQFILEHQYDIGESIQLTDFYKVLQKVKGVVDVIDLQIENQSGAQYSDVSYNMSANLTPDGRRVEAKNNIVFELKFPNVDIKGSVR